ncbi:hypothetical protein B484DRAFT_422434, partial [Ochromonadaceae sp. CCMP2298]
MSAVGELKTFVVNYKPVPKFVPFVPQDNEGGASVDSSLACSSNLQGLRFLLKANFLVFLSEVCRNATWSAFVESYLSCRSKPYARQAYAQAQAQAAPTAPAPADDRGMRELDSKVFLVLLRLVQGGEVETLPALLPSKLTVASARANGTNGTGTGTVTGAGAGAGLEEVSKRRIALREQLTALLAALPCLRCPCVLDLLAIMGDGNYLLGARLLRGLLELSQFSRDLSAAFRESILALEQVQQATIVLQGKAAARLSADDAGKSKDKDIKAASFSVLGAKPPPTLVEKQSFAEEVVFLAMFGADIAYTLGCLVGCLEEGGLLKEHSSLFCLDGTHLTGLRGLQLVRALQNLYEVTLPCLTKTVVVVGKLTGQAAPTPEEQRQLKALGEGGLFGLLQGKSLQIMHRMLSLTQRAVTGAGEKTGEKWSGEKGVKGEENSGAVSASAPTDGLQAMREDGIDWLSVFQQVDALGNDLLLLAARDDDATDLRRKGQGLGQGQGHGMGQGQGQMQGMEQGRGKGRGGGATYTVTESDIRRGALLGDVVRVYGPGAVEAVVRAALAGLGLSEGGGSSGGGSTGGFSGSYEEVDEASVQYVLQSLQQGAQSLLSTAEEVRTRKGQRQENDFMRGVDEITLKGKSNSGKQSTSSAAKAKVSSETAILNIKSIFPHLGEGFIQACLDVYGGSDAQEEVIEALLLDNLNPKLLLLDRGLQKMWKGKGGGNGDRISVNGAARDAEAYREVEDGEFKQRQIMRVREMERQSQEDAAIISREYQDDYDDQFDEHRAKDWLRQRPEGRGEGQGQGMGIGQGVWDRAQGQAQAQAQAQMAAIAGAAGTSGSWAPSGGSVAGAGTGAGAGGAGTGVLARAGGADLSEVSQNRRDRRKAAKDAAVGVAVPLGTVLAGLSVTGAGAGVGAHVRAKAVQAPPPSREEVMQQMQNMRRFNGLYREAEDEQAYWEGMKNTNHGANNSGGGKSTKDNWKRQLRAEEEEGEALIASGYVPGSDRYVLPPGFKGFGRNAANVGSAG